MIANLCRLIRHEVGGNEPEFRTQYVAHCVHALPNGIVEQVRIALRSLGLGMAEQFAHNRQRGAAADEQRRERMAQIVNANAMDVQRG